jgi:hypothetical protein
MLTRWSSGIHNITGRLSKPVDTLHVRARAGGHAAVRRPGLQQRAGQLRRPVASPGGGEWWLLEGGSPSQVRGDGYQFASAAAGRVPPLARVPQDGHQDPQGVPLEVRDNSCSEGCSSSTPWE